MHTGTEQNYRVRLNRRDLPTYLPEIARYVKRLGRGKANLLLNFEENYPTSPVRASPQDLATGQLGLPIQPQDQGFVKNVYIQRATIVYVGDIHTFVTLARAFEPTCSFSVEVCINEPSLVENVTQVCEMMKMGGLLWPPCDRPFLPTRPTDPIGVTEMVELTEKRDIPIKFMCLFEPPQVAVHDRESVSPSQSPSTSPPPLPPPGFPPTPSIVVSALPPLLASPNTSPDSEPIRPQSFSQSQAAASASTYSSNGQGRQKKGRKGDRK
ncbi:unnamed protein product [Vitrella brassicaformis CCMP3155]|uniref:Uncharacterized protein n=1 Tax=Vitrella brassicaformis (strain CCMP3155) TaxID=1169540 RepID=A0A0G4GXG6_VITBC|nr:unnamed protein product [Vitrella brassicaformis CCMP3155]|eukprot:CEM35735.1 unnamed protein product [Vitrella brassicaformis CCMP3155]